MFSITGATGRVGSAAADALLTRGEDVRVVVRDEARGRRWVERGAEVAVADLDDRSALAQAIEGSDGVFVLLPFDLGAVDFEAETSARVRSIAGAVADSRVPHVVALSSLGAHLPAGTGPIVGLHDLEEALRATGATVTALRPGHFQEKVGDVLDAALGAGMYPVLAGSADVAKPMVATRDIGAVVAEVLASRPVADEVVDLLGPPYTEREVAELLGRELGRPLEVVVVPGAGWRAALVDSGLPPHVAEVLLGLYDADDHGGLLVPRGDRVVRCPTDLATTIRAVVAAPAPARSR